MSSSRDYAPLSKAAVKRILAFDRQSGFGSAVKSGCNVTLPNRNRFYTYLTQRGSDVQVRTVAVKQPKRTEEPMVKEVTRTSVADPYIHIRDLGFAYMGGYVVDWTPQGFGRERSWSYGFRWESEAYALRCNWKIAAPVINPELLKRTRRFRWSAWKPEHGYILDYLKIYHEHPEIEFLSKQGLGAYCTRVSVVRKLKRDKSFRQFFSRNAAAIRDAHWSVPTIFKAYSTGVSFADAAREIDARRKFYRLPRNVSARKALQYCERRKIRRDFYATHLRNCQMLGLDLGDTKVYFPKQFNARQQIVQELADAERAKRDAVKNRKMNRQIAAAASNVTLHPQRGAYQIVIPRSMHDLVVEGRAMSNCLGQASYAARIARGESLIVFVRQSQNPKAAFVAVEYDLKRGAITQCYGSKNSKPPKTVRNFIERVFDGIGTDQLREAA